MLYERITLGFGIGFIVGGGAMMAEVAKAGAMYSTGLVMIVLGVLVVTWFMLTRQFRAVTQPAKDAYELGSQIGFDRGYLEGRATARPVVVPFASASTCLECDDRKRLEEHARRIDVRSEAALGEMAGDDTTPRRAAADAHRAAQRRSSKLGY